MLLFGLCAVLPVAVCDSMVVAAMTRAVWTYVCAGQTKFCTLLVRPRSTRPSCSITTVAKKRGRFSSITDRQIHVQNTIIQPAQSQ